MSHIQQSKNTQAAFTLIELMIAMVLSLILMGGVMQIYTGSKTAHRTQAELGRIQENARYAIEAIRKDLRMAGYMGCFGQATLTNNVKAAYQPTAATFFTTPITGYEGTSDTGSGTSDWTPGLDNYFANGQVIPGSDVIAIQRVANFSTGLIGNLLPDNANIQIDTNPNNSIVAGDILVLSDCVDSDIFKASNVSSGGGTITIAHASNFNNNNNLSKLYGPDAKLMRFINNAYYVGNNTNGGRSLFRAVLGSGGAIVQEELVDGVESLQITYGEDLTNDGLPNRYVNADAVTIVNNIVAIRFGLLMYTTQQVATQDDTRTFTVAGTAIQTTGSVPTHGADRSLRQVYNTTVKVRNRGM